MDCAINNVSPGTFLEKIFQYNTLWWHVYHLFFRSKQYMYLLQKSFSICPTQKSVASVDLLYSRCKKRVMKSIAKIEGINSIVPDPPKNTATIVRDADPALIIKKVRKCRRSAEFVSIALLKRRRRMRRKIHINRLRKPIKNVMFERLAELQTLIKLLRRKRCAELQTLVNY